MVQSINEIFAQHGLFYWCSSAGDIRMPGDGKRYIVHHPEELPPAIRQLYEAYQTEAGECMRHVVTYNGFHGMFLAALYDKSYYIDICNDHGIKDLTCARETILMDVALQLLYRQAEIMDEDPAFDGCTCFVGNNTDPDGHELGLFIPAKLAKNIDTIEKDFCRYLYPESEKELIAKAMSFLRPDNG